MARVTCKFTVDDEVKTVQYEDRTLTVNGNLRDLESEKTIEFSTRPNEIGELRIEGKNNQDGDNCVSAGLLLHCQAANTSSPWHNFTSNTANWKTLDGSEVCTNGEGFVQNPGNLAFIQSLLANGAKKIWSEKQTVTLIGKPLTGTNHCKR